ncbi:hypothetical protein [Oceanospirillum sediminis]|uniref:Uncharacterized protein n=1 Tax=Oceanospirillum sediminis TaxID=2760088 RepID=A0A839IPS9_9GAMM|nr:hypothetical protein [Oceanospirillum sediminis]MBB1486246.1 hypothetical protein [Oceanospirillum sediminis]
MPASNLILMDETPVRRFSVRNLLLLFILLLCFSPGTHTHTEKHKTVEQSLTLSVPITHPPQQKSL